MDVSVIIPVFNEENYIGACLYSLISGMEKSGFEVEILVIDGMSTDHTREIAKSYGDIVKVVENPRRNAAAAMNIGIKAARGNYIVRIDAHAVYPNAYVERLLLALDEYGVDNAGGVCSTLPGADTCVAKAVANAMSSPFGMGNSYFRIGIEKPRFVDTVPFGCFRKDIFEKIGGFEERLVRNQDDEFNGRIIRNGGRIILLPDIEIKYFARKSLEELRRMFYQYGLFKPLVGRLLGRPATLRQFAPPVFLISLIVLFLMSLLDPFFFWIIGGVMLVWSLGALFFAFAKTRDLKVIVAMLPAFLTMHLSYGVGYIRGIFSIPANSSVKLSR